MILNLPKILIITAFKDEAQLKECIKSVKNQKNVITEHIFIEGLNLLDSQKRTLYLANKYKNDFDFILKLDADMILLTPFVLVHMVNFLVKNNLNRVMTKVFDHYSMHRIVGMHLLKASIIPQYTEQRIQFPQPDKWISDIKPTKSYSNLIAIVDHGKFPTPKQSLRYGFNRGKKLNSLKKGSKLISVFVNLYFLVCFTQRKQFKLSLLGFLFGLFPESSLFNNINEIDEILINDLSSYNIAFKINFLLKTLYLKKIKLNIITFIIVLINLFLTMIETCFYKLKYKID
tara:strand:- start:833 stop:1696 length:864 start_codon:yes stop_codon:yes gene_type:complete